MTTCFLARIDDLRSLRQCKLRGWLKRCAGVEPLERRRLLAATLAADGTLTVTGTPGNDTINISANPTTVSVIINGGAALDFPTGDVARVSVLAGEGNDGVDISSVGHDLHATLRGEGGNDYLIGSEFNDSIDGGDGNDTMFAETGSDTLRGGNDNDGLFAETDGADILDGGAGPFDAAQIGPRHTLLNDEWFFELGPGNEIHVTVNASDGADDVFLTGDSIRVDGYRFDFDGSSATWVVNLKGGNDTIEIGDTAWSRSSAATGTTRSSPSKAPPTACRATTATIPSSSTKPPKCPSAW